MDKLSYSRHRFPSIVIQQAVWLYFLFALSYRDVEDIQHAAPCASPFPRSRSRAGSLP